MAEQEEPVEGLGVPVEVPETLGGRAREAIRMQSLERVERSSSSVKESWMERVGESCPPGALRGQRQAASLEVGLEVGR